MLELGEFCRCAAELVLVGADVDAVDGAGFVPDELHGDALRDSGCLEECGDGGAQGVEGFAVPAAAAALLRGGSDADAVQADELGEFRAGVGVVPECGVYPDGGVSSLPEGFCVFGVRPLPEPRLHGEVEFSPGFPSDEVDLLLLPVELFPAEVEDVPKALAVGAKAAAYGGGPFGGEFGDEEVDFFHGEGFVEDAFVSGIRWDGDADAGVFGEDFCIYCPAEGGVDGGECFAYGFVAYVSAAFMYPGFDVCSGDKAYGVVCAGAQPAAELGIIGAGVVVGGNADSA